MMHIWDRDTGGHIEMLVPAGPQDRWRAWRWPLALLVVVVVLAIGVL